jgi:hypothetical protein
MIRHWAQICLRAAIFPLIWVAMGSRASEADQRVEAVQHVAKTPYDRAYLSAEV